MSLIPFFGCMMVLISCCYKIKVLKNFFKAFLFYLQGCLIILLFIAPEWMIICFAGNLPPNVFVTIVVISFFNMVCLHVACNNRVRKILYKEVLARVG